MSPKSSEKETLLKLISKLNSDEVQKISIFMSGLEAGRNLHEQRTSA